jgi:hypothetical protein
LGNKIPLKRSTKRQQFSNPPAVSIVPMPFNGDDGQQQFAQNEQQPGAKGEIYIEFE